MAETSPLPRRMIENMTICDLSPAMQRSSIHAVAKFSRYFGRSPDRLEVPLIALGISWTALNRIVCALRFNSASMRLRPAVLLSPC